MQPLRFRGRVEQGEGMATKLGCPTANIAVEQGVIIPALGVYFAETECDSQRYPSLVCINDGRSGYRLKMEVHLLGVEKDLTSKRLSVVLLKKTRDLVPFESDEQMSELIAKDMVRAKEWFANRQALSADVAAA